MLRGESRSGRLKAFIDESQTDGVVFVLAGYLANSQAWERLTEDWTAHLAGPPKWHKLKSKGAERKIGNDPAFRHRYVEHYKLIKKYVTAEICVAIPINTFDSIADEFKLRGSARNIYFFAFNALISLYCGHARKAGITDSVEFIFDERTESGQIHRAWSSFYHTMPHKHRRLIVSEPKFQADTRCKPLQTADFIAHWKMKEYLRTGTVLDHLGPTLPWPEPEPDYALIYGELTELAIREIISQQFRGFRWKILTNLELCNYGTGWLFYSKNDSTFPDR